MSSLPPITEMERVYRERDASYDGVFFLGVRTTGIFCRPRCPARRPLSRNVEYFASSRDALFAGYRPCKRCQPRELNGQRGPSKRMQEDAAPNIDANGGFDEAFLRTFGAAPAGDSDGPRVFVSWVQAPVGPLVAGATDDGICLLEFSDRQRLERQFSTLRRVFRGGIRVGTNRHLETLNAELAEYFAGTRRAFSVPLTYSGTPFQRRVWEELLAIPYGETRFYEALALALHEPRAVRAVGHANGRNPIAIVIPCHRVIGKDGGLGGYGGGLRRKQYLLDLEQGRRGLW
jgi:AraC family transcriptional regulator, regulatory protein of adaptative response / methylated-DNA-[protein]-cysteine methyltransferase